MEIKLKLKHYAIGGALALSAAIGAVGDYALNTSYLSKQAYFQGIEAVGNKIQEKAKSDDWVTNANRIPTINSMNDTLLEGLVSKVSNSSNLNDGDKKKFTGFIRTFPITDPNLQSAQMEYLKDFEKGIGDYVHQLGVEERSNTLRDSPIEKFRDWYDERFEHKRARD